MKRLYTLLLLSGVMALASSAWAGVSSSASKAESCPNVDEPGVGKRVLQNQAMGKALDKSPIGIAMARRAKKKHIDDVDGCPMN